MMDLNCVGYMSGNSSCSEDSLWKSLFLIFLMVLFDVEGNAVVGSYQGRPYWCSCFIRDCRKSDQMKSHFECLIPGLILSAEALCERSQVSLSIAALSGETILLYFQLYCLAL